MQGGLWGKAACWQGEEKHAFQGQKQGGSKSQHTYSRLGHGGISTDPPLTHGHTHLRFWLLKAGAVALRVARQYSLSVWLVRMFCMRGEVMRVKAW